MRTFAEERKSGKIWRADYFICSNRNSYRSLCECKQIQAKAIEDEIKRILNNEIEKITYSSNELKQIYKDAYEDEKKALELAVVEAIKNFDKYGQLKQDFKNLLGTTEDFYQAINDFDPNLKNVIADDVAFKYGNSPLEYYLINGGVGTVLADNDTGKTIRSFIEQTGLALMESFTIWSLENSQTTRKDALKPIVCGEEYALVRTLGTINEMLNEIEINSCYRIAMNVFTQRQESIMYLDASLDEYLNSTGDELFEAWSKGQNFEGRQKALNDTIDEWNNALYEWKSTFLNTIGIEEADALVTNLKNIMSNTPEYEKIKEIQNTIGQQYIYSIIDKNNKISGSFLSSISNVSAVINNDGMCSISSLDGNRRPIYKVIIDKNGKILFQDDKEPDEKGNQVLYYDVTTSGNIFKKTLTSDFEHGDYEILELVTPNGKTKKLMEGGYINISEASGYEDYYKFFCGYEDDRSSQVEGVINAKTGEIIAGDSAQEILNTIMKNEYADLGADVEMQPLGYEDSLTPVQKGTRLNDNYVFYENIIYDNQANEIKVLDTGRGVKDILYANDYYWIVSNTGWYYVLDKKFNQVLEPIQFKENDDYVLTQYGLIIASETKNSNGSRDFKFTLYNEKGNATIELPGQINLHRDISGFIAGNEKIGWVNLNTKEVMLVSSPNKKISTIEF